VTISRPPRNGPPEVKIIHFDSVSAPKLARKYQDRLVTFAGFIFFHTYFWCGEVAAINENLLQIRRLCIWNSEPSTAVSVCAHMLCQHISIFGNYSWLATSFKCWVPNKFRFRENFQHQYNCDSWNCYLGDITYIWSALPWMIRHPSHHAIPPD